ncbi:rod shape-determining protein MreC [Acetoanaerobium pronyense]|uniref:Cell shape-determining protein MreC n=1 Tax=Acetoanaerobium pronyense TaxID=1482736 RepID=A0ABS4KJZ2_9FIRM|nr:rod shape-determining protein MreC [Acetoanaerobium pronyense]MBP2028106.1 rod shape-determining protein MreC [Acetoanaerobium pronyense]
MNFYKDPRKMEKKTLFFIVTGGILILTLFFSIKNGNNNIASKAILETTSPVNGQISEARGGFSNLISSFFPNGQKDIKIQELENQVAELRDKQIHDFIVQRDVIELRELKGALNFIEDEYEQNYITTSIVAKNDGNYYTTFTLSAGENDGVKKDSIVLAGKGLVGRIYEVSANYSKAISILDNKSSVSFEVLRNNEYTGIASQNINIDSETDFEGFIKGYMFDINYDVVPGDVIITSGLGMYPRGIQIGEIYEVIEDPNNLLKYVKIRPYVNFRNLSKLLILNPREIN